ncbi:hypothetical protein V5028_24315 [Enterobacter hormaechei]|uniref:hypothetical protein n=1 Tax=Enterobacter hormaechei TaxID=158836 RepID=UPI001E58469E|nr:hypothetical protein [Enterobacter hormaechei]MCU2425354.1 hypothetical protein [Enterobacter hormaechei subsp. hoffmannii]MCU2951154.1 hypothetical protein [Enterobacter hormaechei subsp. hoffmannii]MCU3337164.1 hypothetical protein [Enterobacter hormaechei subsp. hoffmannii]MCU3754156.1 hypothetical protein [Enterobacter hormaechei subsp. hoffmannii]
MLALVVASLAGCSTQAERLAKCEAQGVSRDACYIADQNRQATINAAAEKQALENAANAVQHSQSAHKHLPKGCTQLQDANGQCDVKPAKQSSSLKQLSGEADHVMNKPISDAAEYLLSKGWKPNNGVWNKGGYVLQLVVENEIVMNAQLTK